MEQGKEVCPDPLFGRIVKTAADCEPYEEPPPEFEAVLAISKRGSLHLPEKVLEDLDVTGKNQRIMMYNWDTSIALARPPVHGMSECKIIAS